MNHDATPQNTTLPSEKYKRTTVTAALPYANGPLHIGHLAGAYLPADIYVRYLRLKKHQVAFICGSDEHGAAITLRAKKEGISPQAIVDKYHPILKKSFEDFGISFDYYHRTSEPLHHQTAQEFFKTIEKKQGFVVRQSEQFFDEAYQQFLADRYIIGTCPKCGHEAAYGDQCEKCGTALSPTELINPKSVLSGKTPILKQTKHWYLPMQDYENWLKEWILNQKKDTWKTNVYGQCKSWLEQGLQERAMTRDLDWGVPVPLPDTEGKVLYVWLDAPIGYVSATKAWAAEKGQKWEDFWKKDDTRLLHFIGKDNIVFHCIIFPIILKAQGEFILPENVPANEFLNLEGNKISTSREWAVWLHEYLQDFAGKEDVLRYVLTSIAPETKDSEFTWKDFQTRNNNELVATLGNFVNRTVVLVDKYFDKVTPERNGLTQYDEQVLAQIGVQKQKIEQAIEHFKFREALHEGMELARIGNKYLADTEPWKLIKTDPELVGTILNIALQITANLALLLRPFLPKTSDHIGSMLGFDTVEKKLSFFDWENAGKDDLLSYPMNLGVPSLLFEKIEDAAIEAQIEKLEATKIKTPTLVPQKTETTFEDFSKMDIRIATIKAAEKVAKADKLLKLTLETGLDERTVVSGIAQYYKPEEIIGKRVCLLANLAPRKIKGIESKGMVLLAEDSEGKLVFVSPEIFIQDGSVVR
ncbi:methionine--tRNA ligase [Hugenholtzia roseola]|uniref:methionine--tRNA ligase n=1 Tax=Hugenholtzia roseola TaxID=1002 RepID=UPI00047B2B34|nr:methionine--tRNA ligase [Hugenholtzia roseola]